jgi:catechol 2,3-dioxygenase-like lactoylglutathione lyase family enzyme
MISNMTHVSIYVLNQDSAYDFYVNKLGFKVIQNVPMGGDDKWLTVSPPEQPGFEIILWPVKTGDEFSEETVKALTALIQKGAFGVGLFSCRDIAATYEELKTKGVVFTKVPTREAHGIEAIFKDDSGNWFSLLQH